jgi:hypothetical protein
MQPLCATRAVTTARSSTPVPLNQPDHRGIRPDADEAARVGRLPIAHKHEA